MASGSPMPMNTMFDTRRGIDKAAKRFLGDGPEAEKGAKRAKELLKRFLDR